MQISLNLTSITGPLHEHQYKCFITSHSFLLGLTNVSKKICRENDISHIAFNNILFKTCLL